MRFSRIIEAFFKAAGVTISTGVADIWRFGELGTEIGKVGGTDLIAYVATFAEGLLAWSVAGDAEVRKAARKPVFAVVVVLSPAATTNSENVVFYLFGDAAHTLTEKSGNGRVVLLVVEHLLNRLAVTKLQMCFLSHTRPHLRNPKKERCVLSHRPWQNLTRALRSHPCVALSSQMSKSPNAVAEFLISV